MNYHELEEPPVTSLPMGRNCSSLKYSSYLLKFKHEANGEDDGRELLATVQACQMFPPGCFA